MNFRNPLGISRHWLPWKSSSHSSTDARRPKNFVYLDENKIDNYNAAIYGGLIQEETRSESVRNQQNIEAGLEIPLTESQFGYGSVSENSSGITQQIKFITSAKYNHLSGYFREYPHLLPYGGPILGPISSSESDTTELTNEEGIFWVVKLYDETFDKDNHIYKMFKKQGRRDYREKVYDFPVSFEHNFIHMKNDIMKDDRVYRPTYILPYQYGTGDLIEITGELEPLSLYILEQILNLFTDPVSRNILSITYNGSDSTDSDDNGVDNHFSKLLFEFEKQSEIRLSDHLLLQMTFPGGIAVGKPDTFETVDCSMYTEDYTLVFLLEREFIWGNIRRFLKPDIYTIVGEVEETIPFEREWDPVSTIELFNEYYQQGDLQEGFVKSLKDKLGIEQPLPNSDWTIMGPGAIVRPIAIYSEVDFDRDSN